MFVKELSIFNCSLEGDAEIIIKALLAGDTNHTAYEHVINDAFVLADGFLFCSFSHVKRLCNSVAHFLARRSKFGNEFQVWIESIPDDIAPLVTCNS